VVLAEPTWLGQRVKKFRVSVPAQPSNNHRDWVTLAEGTTVGHKRIVRVPETKAKYLRIEILDSRACPALTNVGVHKTVAGAAAATAATAAPTTTTTTTPAP
jgi:alpha-L-fucosidase